MVSVGGNLGTFNDDPVYRIREAFNFVDDIHRKGYHICSYGRLLTRVGQDAVFLDRTMESMESHSQLSIGLRGLERDFYTAICPLAVNF